MCEIKKNRLQNLHIWTFAHIAIFAHKNVIGRDVHLDEHLCRNLLEKNIIFTVELQEILYINAVDRN